MVPWASMIIGTRRNAIAFGIDGEQAVAAGCLFQHLRVAQQPRKFEHEFLRVSAEHREPGHRERVVEFGADMGQSSFAEHDARALHRIGEKLIVARQLAQPGAGFLIEIAKRIGRHVGVEPVGLREHDIEGDRRGAEPGQIGDDVGDPGSRPGKLTEFRQTLFVDIDDGDRRLGHLRARFDALEVIEGADAKLLDRSRIGDAQGGDADQQRQAHQPRIAELPFEPPA